MGRFLTLIALLGALSLGATAPVIAQDKAADKPARQIRARSTVLAARKAISTPKLPASAVRPAGPRCLSRRRLTIRPRVEAAEAEEAAGIPRVVVAIQAAGGSHELASAHDFANDLDCGG